MTVHKVRLVVVDLPIKTAYSSDIMKKTNLQCSYLYPTNTQNLNMVLNLPSQRVHMYSLYTYTH